MLAVTLAPFIVHLLYSPALAEAAPVLQILILGAAMMVMNQLLSTTMMAARAQAADLRSMTFGLAALVARRLVARRRRRELSVHEVTRA